MVDALLSALERGAAAAGMAGGGGGLGRPLPPASYSSASPSSSSAAAWRLDPSVDLLEVLAGGGGAVRRVRRSRVDGASDPAGGGAHGRLALALLLLLLLLASPGRRALARAAAAGRPLASVGWTAVVEEVPARVLQRLPFLRQRYETVRLAASGEHERAREDEVDDGLREGLEGLDGGRVGLELIVGGEEGMREVHELGEDANAEWNEEEGERV